MNTIENHQATLSLLNYLNSSSKNNIFNEIISANQEQYQATLQKYGYGTAGSTTDSVYSKVETSTSNLLDAMEALKNEDLYAANQEGSNEPGAYVKAVSNFVSAYNSSLTSISSSGKAISNTFLPELDAAYEKSADLLEKVGIKRGADGQLIIDQDALLAADPEDVRKAVGGDSSYMSLLYSSTSSLNEIVGSALSYMSSYNGAGVSSDLASAMSSSFNYLG